MLTAGNIMADQIGEEVETCTGAIRAVFNALGKEVDLRKVYWANYPYLRLDRNELEKKVEKDTEKLEKKLGGELRQKQLWYVGVPTFKVIRRGVSHLNCQIDLYYVAHGTEDDIWYGKLLPEADKFDVPLALIAPLLDAMNLGHMETNDANIAERSQGYTIYEYMGREWKIPDAFLGFAWALAERGLGFEGLLDPLTCTLIEKFTKELPSPETPKLIAGSDYDDLVISLKGLGYSKAESEQTATYVIDKFPNENLEVKVREALKFLGNK